MKAWKWVSAHSCHGSCSTAPGVRTVAETENTGHLSVRARAQSRGHGALSQSQKQGLCCRPAPGRPAKGWGRKDLVSEGSPGPRVWASCSVAWRTLIAGPEMGRSGDDLPKKATQNPASSLSCSRHGSFEMENKGLSTWPWFC